MEDKKQSEEERDVVIVSIEEVINRKLDLIYTELIELRDKIDNIKRP